MVDYLLYEESDILERVDEYALYCLYLGYEPLIGGKYPSPLREDDTDPSFGLYEPKRKIGSHEFMWKDNGGKGKFGNIFELVRLMYGLESKRQALLKVMADTGIGGTVDIQRVIVPIEPKFLDPIDIAIASRPFTLRDYNFWKQGNISKEILEHHNVKALRMYWLTKDQKTPDFPKGLGFAYPIYDKYQLYFPQHPEKKKKFRHNYTEACLHGFAQLKYQSDLLLITKSRKDIMVLNSFDYESVAPRSENTLVPAPFMELFRRKYKKILILFDNDMKHKGDEYPEKKIYVPHIKDTDKDPFDFCINHGVQETAEMLRQITQS